MVLPRDFLEAVLRLLITLALAIDAAVHLQLASYYQFAQPGRIGQGTLFRWEAAAAIAAGLYVLFRGSRPAYAFALLVATAGAAAVLLYRYVDVPAFGPIPEMYEPVWYFQKSLSAIAEAAGAGAAAVGLFRPHKATQPHKQARL